MFLKEASYAHQGCSFPPLQAHGSLVLSMPKLTQTRHSTTYNRAQTYLNT